MRKSSNLKDENDKDFFKPLVGDFREQLDIPDAFVQRFKGLIGKSVMLESGCGHTFDVEIAKNLDKVAFQTGWKTFVTAHDLNLGEVLVFKYDGTSRFKVDIFGRSSCVRVPPCLVKRNHICGRERSEMHIEISSSSEDLPMESPESKRKAWKQMKGSINVKTSASTFPPDTSGDSISPEDQNSRDVPAYILPQGTRLTSEQMKKLKQKIRDSTSTIPIYGCIIKKNNVQGRAQTLDMPRVYAEVYLPFEDQTVMLQCYGKSWEVRCLIKKGNPGTKRFVHGWKQFACDKKLQLGDLCLFELLEDTKYTMKVHVIRAK